MGDDCTFKSKQSLLRAKSHPSTQIQSISLAIITFTKALMATKGLFDCYRWIGDGTNGNFVRGSFLSNNLSIPMQKGLLFSYQNKTVKFLILHT